MPGDWDAIWPFLRHIVAAGETYCYDRGLTEGQARRLWLLEPPGQTVVAVGDDHAVLGTAKMHPNQGGLAGMSPPPASWSIPGAAGKAWEGR